MAPVCPVGGGGYLLALNQTSLTWVLGGALLLVAVVCVLAAVRHRRHERVIDLRDGAGDRLHISALGTEQAAGFARRWADIQSDFVDSPRSAVGDAQALVEDIMRTRGYPVGTFDENADLIAVDHPEVTEHYRAARTVLLASRQDQATTEQLRQALIHFRVLVAELLELDPSR